MHFGNSKGFLRIDGWKEIVSRERIKPDKFNILTDISYNSKVHLFSIIYVDL